MLNLTATETLVTDHHRKLLDAAERHRLDRQVRCWYFEPLRARAGWLLVSAGFRLARVRSMATDDSRMPMARAR
jgi:hypothetical protein